MGPRLISTQPSFASTMLQQRALRNRSSTQILPRSLTKWSDDRALLSCLGIGPWAALSQPLSSAILECGSVALDLSWSVKAIVCRAVMQVGSKTTLRVQNVERCGFTEGKGRCACSYTKTNKCKNPAVRQHGSACNWQTPSQRLLDYTLWYWPISKPQVTPSCPLP